MNKIIISIRAAVVCVINAVVVYTCCVAAGDADETTERIRKEDTDG